MNCICPGYVDTERLQAAREDVLQTIVIPVGRLGHAEEIADVVPFLAGERAGSITGSTISLNGGRHMAG